MSQTIFSQEKVVYEKKSYTDPSSGKLYWPGLTPIYLFVADNPEGTAMDKLDSEISKEVTNPMYLDTEGINYIRSRWAINSSGKYTSSPKQEIMFEIYKDSRSPISSLSFTGAKKYIKEGQVYYGKNLTVSMSAKDVLSGVKERYYATGSDSKYNVFKESIPSKDDALNTIKYYSVDNVGNEEAALEKSYYVDVSGPSTEYTITGDHYNDVISPRTGITLSATDNLAGVRSIRHSIDDDRLNRLTKKVYVAALPDGEHSLMYSSIDNVDNIETTKTFKFYLDRIPPVVEAEIIGEKFAKKKVMYIAPSSEIKLSITDNKAGVENTSYDYEGSIVDYEKPFGFPQTSGFKPIKVYSVDNVNNKKTDRLSDLLDGNTLFMDDTAPTINHSFIGKKFLKLDTLYITSETLVKLTSNDLQAGVRVTEFTENTDAESTYGDPFTIDKDGFVTVKYKSTDNVGNTANNDFFVFLDNEGPEVKTILSMETVGKIALDEYEEQIPVYTKGTNFYLGATDAATDTKNIFYRLNGGTERLYTRPIRITKLGINTVTIRATDMLDNESEIKEVIVFIK